MKERFEKAFSNVGFIPENKQRYLDFIQSEIELAKEEDHLKVVSNVKSIFNGYGGALSFTEEQLLDLIDLITNNE